MTPITGPYGPNEPGKVPGKGVSSSDVAKTIELQSSMEGLEEVLAAAQLGQSLAVSSQKSQATPSLGDQPGSDVEKLPSGESPASDVKNPPSVGSAASGVENPPSVGSSPKSGVKNPPSVGSAASGVESSPSVGSSPKSGLGSQGQDANPVIQDYVKAIQAMINYLINTDHIPSSEVQFLVDSLNGIDPVGTNAATQLSQLMHQVCVIGTSVDPNFLKALEGAVTPGVQDASSALATLQKAVQADLAALPADQQSVFKDMIAMQAWLAGWPSNIGDGTALETFAQAFLDLVKNQSSQTGPWTSAIANLFSAMGGIIGTSGGENLSDVLGTVLFWNIMYQQVAENHDGLETFADIAVSMPPAVQNVIQSLQGNPFLSAVANKLTFWMNNWGSAAQWLFQYTIYNNRQAIQISGSYSGMIASLCKFDPNSVATAQTSIQQALSSLEQTSAALQQYAEDSAALNNVQMAFASFSSAQKGDWQDGFPFGPSHQEGDAPSGQNGALNAVFQALIQIYLENNLPLGNLLQDASGPPFSTTAITELQNYAALLPQPMSQKDLAIIQAAFTKIDQIIGSMSAQEKKDAANLQVLQTFLGDIQQLEQDIANIPNLTETQWIKLTADFMNLCGQFWNSPNPEITSMMNHIQNDLFWNCDANMLRNHMGHFFALYLNSQHLSLRQWLQKYNIPWDPPGTMGAFIWVVSTAMDDPSPSASEIQGDMSALKSEISASAAQALQAGLKQADQTITSAITPIQNIVNQDNQQIQAMQNLEKELKSYFPPSLFAEEA